MTLIAKSNIPSKWLTQRTQHAFVMIAVAIFTSACTSSLDLLGSAAEVDRSIATGTIARSGSKTALSDEATVRNAVTSVDLTKLAGSPVPWANAATGSAGVVSAIREARKPGQICRDFKTTRHSYEGIAMFSGQACLTGSGNWLLTAFDRQ